MEDNKIMSFSTVESAQKYFDEQAKTDLWLKPYATDIDVAGLEDAEPLMYKSGVLQIKGQKKNYEKIDSDDDFGISESMSSTGLLISIPNEDGTKRVILPLRCTAVNGLCSASGISGPAISILDENSRRDAMDADTRAKIFYAGLSRSKMMNTILIRDQKVTAIASADYAILPMFRLLKAVNTEVTDHFQSAEFRGCETGYEITRAEWILHDDEISKNVAKSLTSHGKATKASDVSISLVFTSSDVGLCEARISPVISVKGVSLSIGKAESVRHYGDADIAKFCDICVNVLCGFKNHIKDIEKMLQITIQNPSSCFKNLMNKLNLQGYGKFVSDTMARIENEITSTCTAYDLFWYLGEMVYSKYQGQDDSLFQSIRDSEEIAKVINFDFSKFDC